MRPETGHSQGHFRRETGERLHPGALPARDRPEPRLLPARDRSQPRPLSARDRSLLRPLPPRDRLEFATSISSDQREVTAETASRQRQVTGRRFPERSHFLADFGVSSTPPYCKLTDNLSSLCVAGTYFAYISWQGEGEGGSKQVQKSGTFLAYSSSITLFKKSPHSLSSMGHGTRELL